MKNIILLAFTFFTLSISSQDLLPKSIYTLNSIGVNTEKLDLNNDLVQQNLNNILYLNRRIKTNKVFAYIFTIYGAASILTGSYLIFQGSYSKDSSNTGLEEILGGAVILGGVAYGSISIPFWIGAKKNKKRRDKLIEIYQ